MCGEERTVLGTAGSPGEGFFLSLPGRADRGKQAWAPGQEKSRNPRLQGGDLGADLLQLGLSGRAFFQLIFLGEHRRFLWTRMGCDIGLRANAERLWRCPHLPLASAA